MRGRKGKKEKGGGERNLLFDFTLFLPEGLHFLLDFGNGDLLFFFCFCFCFFCFVFIGLVIGKRKGGK